MAACIRLVGCSPSVFRAFLNTSVIKLKFKSERASERNERKTTIAIKKIPLATSQIDISKYLKAREMYRIKSEKQGFFKNLRLN